MIKRIRPKTNQLKPVEAEPTNYEHARTEKVITVESLRNQQENSIDTRRNPATFWILRKLVGYFETFADGL